MFDMVPEFKEEYRLAERSEQDRLHLGLIKTVVGVYVDVSNSYLWGMSKGELKRFEAHKKQDRIADGLPRIGINHYPLDYLVGIQER